MNMPWNDFEPVDIEHVNKKLSWCWLLDMCLEKLYLITWPVNL